MATFSFGSNAGSGDVPPLPSVHKQAQPNPNAGFSIPSSLGTLGGTGDSAFGPKPTPVAPIPIPLPTMTNTIKLPPAPAPTINISPPTPTSFEEGIREAMDLANSTGSYKQLWQLLLGTNTVSASKDIITEELNQRKSNLLSGLMRYEPVKKDSIPKISPKSSRTDRLRVELMKKLNIQESLVNEVLCLYLVHEYKGKVKSLKEILQSDVISLQFVEDIYEFYKRERLSLIYCAAAILHGATDIDHEFKDVFMKFISEVPMTKWCENLCRSLNRTESDEERVQTLHVIALFLHEYGDLEGVFSTFNLNFKFVKTTSVNRDILYAEALLTYSLLQSEKITDDRKIEEFLLFHITEIDINPYIFGAIVSCNTRCGSNDKIREAIQGVPNPHKCVSHLIELLEAYDVNSYRNKHCLSPRLYKSAYYGSEYILSTYLKRSFGDSDDWFKLLDVLLKDKAVTQMFLVEQPDELCLVYSDAVMLFPVEVKWLLSYWGRIARASSPDITAVSIISRLTEINAIAEEFQDIDTHVIRPNGNKEWLLLEERTIGGVFIRAGATGSTVREEGSLVISWELDAPNSDVTVWEVLFEEIIKPCMLLYPKVELKLVEQIDFIAKFLVEFSNTSPQIPQTLLELFPHIITLLTRLVQDGEGQVKSKYLAHLLQVTGASSVFNPKFIASVAPPVVWPHNEEASIVSDVILSYESVLNSSYIITKTYLQLMNELFQMDSEDPYNLAQGLHSRAFNIDCPKNEITKLHLHGLRAFHANNVYFILENIYPSFVRWRSKRAVDQFEIIRDTFRVVLNLFLLKDPKFNSLKDMSCKILLTPNSSILAVLAIEEEKLQDAWIRTSPDNMYLDQTMYFALSLIVELAKFDIRTLQLLDTSSNLKLVKHLGKLVHHRINPVLATLAVGLLRRIAEELDISLLACFGDKIESFRDLLLQRLQYKSEDVNLKVAILEFLAICAQTQPGIMQNFFEDNEFTTCLLDLLSEQEVNVSIAALLMIRALYRKGNTLFKRQHSNVWSSIIKPIRTIKSCMKMLHRKKIVMYTMNIFSFELHTSGMSDNNFSNVLKEVVNPEILEYVIKISMSGTDDRSKKCLSSLKHFLTLLISREDFESLIQPDTRASCSKCVSSAFWGYVNKSEEADLHSTLAEMMLILGPISKAQELEDFSILLLQKFDELKLPVQLPLLSLVHKSILHIKEIISGGTIENIVRMISSIFSKAVKLIQTHSTELARPLLAISSSIMYAVIATPTCRNWLPIFKQHMLINSIISVAHTGLMKSEAPDVVIDCLSSLIKLTERSETSDILLHSTLSRNLWFPSVRYATADVVDPKWHDVYLLCCGLNSAMFQAEKFYYMEDTFNYWSVHGEYLINRLFALSELINHCYLNSSEQNFVTIKRLLMFNVTIIHSLTVMVPCFQHWRLHLLKTLSSLMEGALSTLQTAVNLLSQPNLLLLVIHKPPKPQGSPAFKLTPQLLEVQTRLWEVMALGINLFSKVSLQDIELIDNVAFIPFLFSAIGVCIRTMSKHGEKKSTPSPNLYASRDLIVTLEKSLVLLHYLLTDIAFHSPRPTKEEKTFRVETATEITSVCDTLRRIGLSPGDFSLVMCTRLEDLMKQW